MLPLDAKAAIQYARLRCDRSIRPADAILLACASVARVDLFITNDERLHAKQVEGIQFVVSIEGVPLYRLLQIEINVFDRQIPMSIENFEAALLFFFVGVLIGIKLPDERG